MTLAAYTAVVLAGGRGRRFPGVDKLGAEVDRVPLLDRVLGSLDGADRIVVVGPTREVGPVRAQLHWVQEEPADGGPVAGLAAALPLVGTEVVVLLAGDLPFTAGLPERLCALLAACDRDAVIPLDAAGRPQLLAAAYRTRALVGAVAAHGPVHGAAVRDVVALLRVHRVPAAELPTGALLDVDTPDDLAEARARAAAHQPPPARG
jgi:molybdopterin-guanine dinucleotide biosynthesis protein A